jgi:hypothetical protein
MKKLLQLAAMVACLFSMFFISSVFNVASAHTVSSALVIIKQVKVINLSSKSCAILQHSTSNLTKNACTMTLVSTTIEPSHFINQSNCPSGDANHAVEDSGLGWGAELQVIFHFPGNCTRPSVSYISCINNMDAFWPYSIDPKACSTTNIDAKRVMAQGVWGVSGILGSGAYNVTIQSIANNNGAISDAKN